VSNGLFTTCSLRHGVFNGAPYWLEIGVRTNGTGAFITLTNRHPLRPHPMLFMRTRLERRQRFGGQEPQRFEDAVTVTGGANITISTNGNNLTFSAVATNGSGWTLVGNGGTSAGANFVGTTDNQARTQGQRRAGVRLEPNVNSPNVIAGYSGNV